MPHIEGDTQALEGFTRKFRLYSALRWRCLGSAKVMPPGDDKRHKQQNRSKGEREADHGRRYDPPAAPRIKERGSEKKVAFLYPASSRFDTTTGNGKADVLFPLMTRLPPLLVLTVIGAIAAFSVMRVHFSANLYKMMPADLPEVQGMDRLNRYFSRDGQLIVTVQADEGFAAADAIAALSEHLTQHHELVADVFRELTLSELVTDGGGLLAWLWLNAPEGKIEPLGERFAVGQSAAVIASAMEVVQNSFFDQDVVIKSYDPLGLSRLGELLGTGTGPDPMSSGDGTFQVMYVEGNGVNFSDYRDAAKWLGRMKEVVAEWEAEWNGAHEGESPVIVGLTGTPAFMAEVGAKMERDMSLSVLSTMLLIALLFWIMHRQSKPLSWIISAMLAILAITLSLGGVVFGDLSVMSAGFAAILMGLAVDYGIVIYREAMDSGGDARTVRKNVGPSIFWAAATTAVVFLSLNLSSLPGLAEMGNLVAMGVAVGALVMLYGFAPVAVSFVRESPPMPERLILSGTGFTRRSAGLFAWLIPLLALVSIAVKEMPGLEINFHPFRIRESPSMIAWQTLQKELRGRENAVPTVITGKSLDELLAHLEAAQRRIDAALNSGLLADAVLPTVFIPHPENQRRNAALIRQWLGDEVRLLAEISAAGFSEDGTALTATTFAAWRTYLVELEKDAYAAPAGKLAAWSIERLFAEKDGTYAALATVKPTDPLDRSWVAAVADENTAVASLGSLGTALNERIRSDVFRVFLPMIAILSFMLILVFRSWKDLLLSLFCLLFVTSVMILATVWTPMSWNSFNICGLPLLFGTGLDYGIHMILALRRNGGDVVAARHGIGKALIFCGASSAIGFGSLATASAYGLASLGLVCAVGILVNMLVAVFLLPRWYRWMHQLGD